MKKQLLSFLNTLSKFAGSKTARGIVLGAFLAQALLLAFITNIGTPPDENNHLRFIRYYADHSISPVFDKQTPTWSLGDKTREVDYLYHYTMSFVARALPGEKAEVYVIRLVSVVAALLTMMALMQLFKRLKISAAASTVSLLIITSLPMVLMISAAVNNDVFVWLGYAVSLLLVLRLWGRPRLLDAILLINVVIAGGLIKRTLLPLGFILVLLAAALIYRKWADFKSSFKKIDWRLILAGVFLLIVSALFIERVGGNLYRYGEVSPTCEQVQGEKACEVFWANSRKKWLDAGAPSGAGSWLGGGVTRDESPMPVPVFAVNWIVHSVTNITDIQTQGWRHKVTPPSWLAPSLFVLLSAVVMWGVITDVQRWRKGEQIAAKRLLVGATAVFVLAVHLYTNYKIYLPYQVFGLALNGRYILPALLILIGLACYYGARVLPRWVAQVLAVVVVLLVVLLSGIIMMLRNGQLVTG